MTTQSTTRREPILSLRDVHVKYPVGRGKTAHAVNGVNLDIYPGETLGLVGESGCGKSTLGKTIVQMEHTTSGEIEFRQTDITKAKAKRLREIRRELQMIFQDPISSLNPRRRVIDIVKEPLVLWGRGTAAEQEKRALELISQVGLNPEVVGKRLPRELSGGQCQRVSIARALALDPAMIICDEPVSALDMSVQAQVLNLLEDLREQFDLTLLFISHDLSVIKNISDRVAVMYLGRIVELTTSEEFYANPAHPYSRALLNAAPSAEPILGGREIDLINGELPSPIDPPAGCHFRARCPFAQAICGTDAPPLEEIRPGHQVACHFPLIADAAQDTVPDHTFSPKELNNV